MFRLEDWYLMTGSEEFRGYGYCYGNPEFIEGLLIYTSPVVRVEVDEEEKRLKLFTFSGSCYVLDFADIREDSLKYTKEAVESMGIAVDLEQCLALKNQKEDDYRKKLSDILKPNELYVVMLGGMGIIKAYFKTKGDDVVPIHVETHISSVGKIVIVAEAGLCDWRILPTPKLVSPYHWSDNIEAIHIENIRYDFGFSASNREILCKFGEVTVIKREEFMGEGLVSPNAVYERYIFSADYPKDFTEKYYKRYFKDFL